MAQKDYYIVKKNVDKIINNKYTYFLDPSTLNKVKSKLKGYNYSIENGFFDCNYKSLRITVKHNFSNHTYCLCSDIDIWDDYNAIMLKEQITINELRKLVNKNESKSK